MYSLTLSAFNLIHRLGLFATKTALLALRVHAKSKAIAVSA